MPHPPAFIADMRRNSRGEISAPSATRPGAPLAQRSGSQMRAFATHLDPLAGSLDDRLLRLLTELSASCPEQQLSFFVFAMQAVRCSDLHAGSEDDDARASEGVSRTHCSLQPSEPNGHVEGSALRSEPLHLSLKCLIGAE